MLSWFLLEAIFDERAYFLVINVEYPRDSIDNHILSSRDILLYLKKEFRKKDWKFTQQLGSKDLDTKDESEQFFLPISSLAQQAYVRDENAWLSSISD